MGSLGTSSGAVYFNSFQFVGFYIVVFGMVTLLRGRVAARNSLLLVASYFFYACWDWRFLSLIWISTAVDFVCGLVLDVKEASPGADSPQTGCLS